MLESVLSSNIPNEGCLVIPRISMDLYYIYGIHTSCKRNSIKYLNSVTRNSSKLDKEQSELICFIISKYAIVYDVESDKQIIYYGHSNRVTYLAIHPKLQLIATTEALNCGCVHIWNYTTLKKLHTIKTAHGAGIILLEFSNDGDYILTLGRANPSVQIFKWSTEEEICFRVLDHKLYVCEMKFSPYDPTEIIEVGQSHIGIWKLRNFSLNPYKYFIAGNEGKPNARVFVSMDLLLHDVH
jgi:WD40 repeat protein